MQMRQSACLHHRRAALATTDVLLTSLVVQFDVDSDAEHVKRFLNQLHAQAFCQIWVLTPHSAVMLCHAGYAQQPCMHLHT